MRSELLRDCSTGKHWRESAMKQSSPNSNVPAVIMAGGFGTRLKYLTQLIPKPMIPVAGRPVLDHVLDQLERHGILQGVLSLLYLPEVIQEYLGSGRPGAIQLSHSIAPCDLGNAGGVLLSTRQVSGDPLLVVSGDVLTNIDLTAMISFHLESKSAFTVALTRVADASDFGLVDLDSSGTIRRYTEKPRGHVFSGWVNSGIYVADRRALNLIPEGAKTDFSHDLIPALLERGLKVSGMKQEGYWFDIGTLTSLKEAEAYFAAAGPMPVSDKPQEFPSTFAGAIGG